MQNRKITTSNEAEMIRAGTEFSALLCPGDTVWLIGDIGAGKTTFAKGVAGGLGGEAGSRQVSSPSFSLINEYETEPRMLHLDMYRLNDFPDDIISQITSSDAAECVVLIEWADKFEGKLRCPDWTVHIQHNGEHSRILEWSDEKI